MFASPYSVMPRNYTNARNECVIRFHHGTAYPWSMTLANFDRVMNFPPFTPVLPQQEYAYTVDNYDKTDVYVVRKPPAQLIAAATAKQEETAARPAPAPIVERKCKRKGRSAGLLVDDYQRGVEVPRNSTSEMMLFQQRLPGNKQLYRKEPEDFEEEEEEEVRGISADETICSNNPTNTRIEMARTFDQFFEGPRNDKPSAAYPINPNLQEYWSLVNDAGSSAAAKRENSTKIEPIPQPQPQPAPTLAPTTQPQPATTPAAPQPSLPPKEEPNPTPPTNQRPLTTEEEQFLRDPQLLEDLPPFFDYAATTQPPDNLPPFSQWTNEMFQQYGPALVNTYLTQNAEFTTEPPRRSGNNMVSFYPEYRLGDLAFALLDNNEVLPTNQPVVRAITPIVGPTQPIEDTNAPLFD